MLGSVGHHSGHWASGTVDRLDIAKVTTGEVMIFGLGRRGKEFRVNVDVQ